MVRINRIVFLFVLLAAIFHTDPVFALADILNIRHWAAPDHTRVVIDVSDDVSYSVDEADKKLIINLEETCVREDFPHELIIRSASAKRSRASTFFPGTRLIACGPRRNSAGAPGWWMAAAG